MYIENIKNQKLGLHQPAQNPQTQTFRTKHHANKKSRFLKFRFL